LVKLYFSLLIFSSLIPILISLNYFRKKNDFSILPIFLWVLVRLFSDIIVFINRENSSTVYSPFVHVAILIESVLLINFFLKNSKTIKYGLLLYAIPFLVFVIETQFVSSIFHTTQIGILSYSFLIVLLMLVLILNQNTHTNQHRSFIKVLFLYHAISFGYFVYIKQLRENLPLMQIIYPVFLVLVVSMNLTISKIIWSKSKNQYF
jgi:hypothetical protein